MFPVRKRKEPLKVLVVDATKAMSEHDNALTEYKASQQESKIKRIQRERPGEATLASSGSDAESKFDLDVKQKLSESLKGIFKSTKFSNESLSTLTKTVTRAARQTMNRSERNKIKMERFVELGGTKPVEKAPLPAWLKRVDEQRGKEDREYRKAKELGLDVGPAPSRVRREKKQKDKYDRERRSDFGLKVQSVGFKAKDGSIRIRKSDFKKVDGEIRSSR